MTNRKHPSASSAEGQRAAEEARRLLARAGKARDEDQDEPKDGDSDEELVEADRDDDELDDDEHQDDDDREDDEEGQVDEEADKRAGRGAERAAIRAAVETDRERAAKVMELARAAGLPNFGQRHVDYGTSVREFRQALKERQGKPGGRAVHRQPSFAKEAARGAQEAKRALGRK